MKKLKGWAKFSDRVVYDEQVWQFVKKHSRLIDRMSGRKMVEMAFLAFSMLSGSVEIPKGKHWKFYGIFKH